MQQAGISRRRFLAVAGAAAVGIPWLGAAGAATAEPVVWRGVALGAAAELRLHAVDRTLAEATIRHCVGEVARLERLFSLHMPDSAITRLNREGRLDRPDPDILHLLSLCRSVHAATDGAFDPTIQPAWTRLARRHAGLSVERDLPTSVFSNVAFDTGSIGFTRPRTAITLNGIAQGYITDRVADLLRNEGFDHALVNVGELRAVSSRPGGRPWPVRVADTELRLDLEGRALATSATGGTTFDAGGEIGHILDPATGRPVPVGRTVSVAAPTAAIADALSTAFCVMGEEARPAALSRFAQAEIIA